MILKLSVGWFISVLRSLTSCVSRIELNGGFCEVSSEVFIFCSFCFILARMHSYLGLF